MPIQYQQMIFFNFTFCLLNLYRGLDLGLLISKAQFKRRALSWHEEHQA